MHPTRTVSGELDLITISIREEVELYVCVSVTVRMYLKLLTLQAMQ